MGAWPGGQDHRAEREPQKPPLWAAKTVPKEQELEKQASKLTIIENTQTQVVIMCMRQDALNTNRNQLKLV